MGFEKIEIHADKATGETWLEHKNTLLSPQKRQIPPKKCHKNENQAINFLKRPNKSNGREKNKGAKTNHRSVSYDLMQVF